MVNTIIEILTPTLSHFWFAGYWLAFFLAFLETVLVVGVFIPGSVLIIFLGAFAAKGFFEFDDLVWFAVVGALLGDNINYYIGRKFGAKILQKEIWMLKKEHVEKAKDFIKKHGNKSVFWSRFIPGLKEIVPFIAGSLNMNKKKFFIFNFLGAIGWGLEWAGIGYIFAYSLDVAKHWIHVFEAIVVLGVLAFYIFKISFSKK